MAQMTAEQQRNAQALRARLRLAPEDSPRTVLFRAGPAASPFGNGLYALAFGMIPFSGFLILAALQGDVRMTGLLDWLYSTIGVPWGLIYLFFFGYAFRLIAGDFGVLKGLALSAVLMVFRGLYAIFWQFMPPEPVEVWGDMLRILITFVFTGAMLDWATSGFSWPQIRRSYNSPAVTTIIAVTGTAGTTILTGLLTGTLSQLLTIAIQSGAAVFNLPPGAIGGP